MFDALDRQEWYGLAGAAVLLVAVGFGAGTLTANDSTPTGNVGTAENTDAVRQSVQTFMDQQLARQQQRLQAAVNRSENLTADDVGMDATVTDVSSSEFGSLYEVTVSVSGTVPQMMGSGTRDINQEQTLYVSQDGRYLFQEPTDLEQPQQPRQPRRR